MVSRKQCVEREAMFVSTGIPYFSFFLLKPAFAQSRLMYLMNRWTRLVVFDWSFDITLDMSYVIFDV
jgi:hypothetical protein